MATRKQGKGARARAKLRRKEARKAAKLARYMAAQKRNGGSINSAGLTERTKRRHHNKGDRRPGKGIEARRSSAQSRQMSRNNLSNAQQIEKLDARLGKGKGAKAERARLSA